MFSDGILILGRKGRVLTKLLPLAVDLLHRVVGNLGEHGLGSFVLLERWRRSNQNNEIREATISPFIDK